MTRATVLSILLVGFLMVAPAVHASSIVNGGFETGDFDGWIVDASSASSVLFVGGHGHSGGEAAWFGAISGRDDSLSQALDTPSGGSYLISFWLAHGATDRSNDFSVWWDDTALLTLKDVAKFGETHFAFVATAFDDQTILRFSGRERINYYYLDDVTVTYLGDTSTSASSLVPNPEPATMTLLLGGLAVVAGRKRMARRTSRPRETVFIAS